MVVVAEDGDTPLSDLLHDRGDHPFGIGAIAYVVAEKKMLLCTILRACRRQASKASRLACMSAKSATRTVCSIRVTIAPTARLR